MPADQVPTAPEDAAARLLHQLNQPLTAIGNYAQAGCQLLDGGLFDPGQLRQIFAKIAEQSGRTMEISRELKHVLRDTE